MSALPCAMLTRLSMAEGDLVTRIFKQNVPDPKDKPKMVERYALDVYRIKDRKIVEHWRGLANLP